MSGKLVTIIADINQRDGWWYATSQQLDGLLIAHKSLTAVKAEIPLVIKALYEAQYNIKVEIKKTTLPYSEDEKQAYIASVR